MEPAESRLLERGIAAPHVLDGIADGFVPSIVERNVALIDEIIAIPGDEAIHEARRLAREHQLLVGPTSGANFLAAKVYKRAHPALEHVVTVFPDTGTKYLSRHFRDDTPT